MVGREGIERRCMTLTAEMVAWLGEPEGQDRPIYDGTVASLIGCYQTDKKSPYHGLALNTQRGYNDWCRTLGRAIGKRRVDHLTGHDLRDCFLALLEPAHPGGAPRVRLAKACVRSMLSVLLNYGAELGLVGCLELAQVLERMTLRVPKDIRATWKPGVRLSWQCPMSKPPRSSMRDCGVELGVTVRWRLGWLLNSSLRCAR
jgi:hypothetical protein